MSQKPKPNIGNSILLLNTSFYITTKQVCNAQREHFERPFYISDGRKTDQAFKLCAH